MARGKRETKGGKAKSAAQQDGTDEARGRDRSPESRSIEGNQGEGNREADRRYREGAANFERSGRVPAAAEEARRSVEDDELRTSQRERDDDDLVDYDADEDELDESDEEEARREARDRSRLS